MNGLRGASGRFEQSIRLSVRLVKHWLPDLPQSTLVAAERDSLIDVRTVTQDKPPPIRQREGGAAAATMKRLVVSQFISIF